MEQCLKNHVPPYTATDTIIHLAAEICEQAGAITIKVKMLKTQQEYYDILAVADKAADSNAFIEFMLLNKRVFVFELRRGCRVWKNILQ